MQENRARFDICLRRLAVLRLYLSDGRGDFFSSLCWAISGFMFLSRLLSLKESCPSGRNGFSKGIETNLFRYNPCFAFGDCEFGLRPTDVIGQELFCEQSLC